MSSGSGLNPGKKKPGSKDYTGVKEEITAPIEQPPVVPEVKEPEPLILPKLPEISPFPEEPKKFEPEYKPEILPEIKKPVILPEVMKPEILPEVKKPEVMPDFKKPAIMPAIMPDFKPEFKPEFKSDFKPPYKPIEPEYTYPVKTMPLPHPIHPMAEPCPPFAEMPLHMMPHPCPEFPFQEAPAFMMPPYGGFHEGPCGCHEPKHWHGSDYGTAVHPYHHIPQEAMPVSYNEGWGDAASGYPGVSEQPMSLEYSQFSITESYTGNMGSDYHPYPEHHHTAPTYGYVPSPCGCHGEKLVRTITCRNTGIISMHRTWRYRINLGRVEWTTMLGHTDIRPNSWELKEHILHLKIHMNRTGMIGKMTSSSIRHSIRRLHSKRSNPICRSAVKLRTIRNHPYREIPPLKRMLRKEPKSIVSKLIKQELQPRNHASLKSHQKASATIPGSRVKTSSMNA